MKPGEYFLIDEAIELNEGRDTIELQVSNAGDRPIQVGSHYHFFEVNESLIFDRSSTRGYRLDIASGTAVRFEPGQSRSVNLIKYGGGGRIFGFQGKVMGEIK